MILVLVILFFADLAFGTTRIDLTDVLHALLGPAASVDPVIRDIVIDLRMTRAITCLLAGSGLALAGLQMQTLFRNPLAGPDVLGLTSGASLAVSLVFMAKNQTINTILRETPWALAAAASAGSAAVFLVMYAVARKLRDNAALLIVGLMAGAASASVVSVIQYLSSAEELQVYLFWTFGSLSGLSWRELAALAVILVTGSVIAFLTLKPLNAWLLGDNYAQSIGINTRAARLRILLSTSILTGGITAFCGPIAFVGLAVPHLVKLVMPTANHRILLPAVFAGGASLLLFCDIIAQTPGTYVLPINAITALIGAPVIVWIIVRKKTRYS